jgi:RNA polymerase sigma-70 factor (ECF subfamily)
VGLISGLTARRQFSSRLERRRERLYGIAFSWCHDRHLADDLVQQTLCKALQSRAQLRDPKAIDPWLYRILANCLRDFHRRRRETVEFDPERGPTAEIALDIAERHDVVTRVRRAVANLPLAQRQVLTLVDLEGCSYNEVSTALEIPPGTVMSRLCRARRALRNELGRGAASGESGVNRRIRRVK